MLKGPETMKAANRAMPVKSSFAASFNREKEWHQCCAAVMGFEWLDHFDACEETECISDDPPLSSKIQQVINLMEDQVEASYIEEMHQSGNPVSDPWSENAIRLQSDLYRMSRWIQTKQHEYVSLDMPDTEASLIQSTVTSFAATTAAELETLRKIIPNSQDNVASHRQGIVQILLVQLQSQITEPFGILQKQRTRISVQLWQNPWQCKLHQPKAFQEGASSSMIQIFDDDNDDAGTIKEQRFLPMQPLDAPDTDVFASYAEENPRHSELPPRPEFIARIARANRHKQSTALLHTSSSDQPAANLVNKKEPIRPKAIQPTVLPYREEPMSEESREQQLQDDLKQEAALLTVSLVQNDLDSVQKMEQRMLQITTLIGQFSNLVSEQQEEIWDIAQHAEKTKENMDKGQENLVDATERTKRSKHYMAWTILGLTMTLWLFHEVRS